MPFSRWPRPTGVRAASTITTSRPCNLVLMRTRLANDRSLSTHRSDVGVDVEGVGVEEGEVALQRHERLWRADQRLDVAALAALLLDGRADLDVEELQRDRQARDALEDVGDRHRQAVVVGPAAERL